MIFIYTDNLFFPVTFRLLYACTWFYSVYYDSFWFHSVLCKSCKTFTLRTNKTCQRITHKLYTTNIMMWFGSNSFLIFISCVYVSVCVFVSVLKVYWIVFVCFCRLSGFFFFNEICWCRYSFNVLFMLLKNVFFQMFVNRCVSAVRH